MAGPASCWSGDRLSVRDNRRDLECGLSSSIRHRKAGSGSESASRCVRSPQNAAGAERMFCDISSPRDDARDEFD